MPYKKKIYKKKKKTPYKKTYTKKVNRDTTYIVSPSIGGMPKSLFTTLKYHDTKTLNVGAAGVNGVTVYTLNGLFDPDVTGVGAQPRGFDQMMTLYDHFYVRASSISCTFWNKDIVQNNTVGIAFRDNATTEVTAYDYIEQDCVYRVLGGQNSGSSQKTIKRFFKYKPYNGVMYKESENKGSVSANPTEQTYAHVFCGNEFGVDTLGTQVTITIEYHALFTEQRDLISS